MKKAFDQTIRDLKREVNKKVLKVPTIEQKILDATSNEPWGPHGSLLIDIAQATRNYHEYQMIMIIIWKRISSTGKNWRHVYKALTVLEYLVANGSERVVDEIREHAYQISTLSNFQYLDSSGRDQGQNVRRKSQTLVNLVGDKEKIQEVREKAATNRDKFKSASAVGMSGSGSGSYSGSGYGDRYDDERYEGRYGTRDDDRNGNGRDGEWNRDDDKYGRYADPYARDGDRYNRDSEERYGRGSDRDDEYRGSYADENQDGSRSSERDRDHAYNDEHHSSRGSSVKAEDHPQEGRPLDQKFSVQSPGAPPSYEDAVGGSKSPVSSGRGGDTPSVPVPNSSPPTTSPSPVQTPANPNSSLSDPNYKAQAAAEFDPRWSQDAAVSGTSRNAETDLLGSLSDAWAITPVSSGMPSADSSASGPFAESNVTATSSAPATVNQSFEDPFGDSPFKAAPSSDDITTQAQNFASASPFQRPSVNTVEQVHPSAHTTNNFGNSEIPDSLSGLTFTTPEPSTFQLPQNPQPMQQQEPSSFQNDDILDGILPPSGPPPPVASQAQFPPTASQPINPGYYNAPNFAYSSQNFVPQSGHPQTEMAAQHLMMPISQNNGMNSFPHATPGSVSSNAAPQVSSGIVPQQTNGILGNINPQAAPAITHSSQPASTSTTGPLAIVSQPAPKEKFELKSAVWTDTLSRGLVNLDISGAKVNPNAGIGVDFDSLNRKEKRMEKPSTTPVTSTINMGKAMGSGSGMGRSGTNTMRPQSNPMMTSGMGMGMGGAPGGGRGMGMGGAPGGGMGMGMGGYGMMNQGQGMGMGVRGNMGNPMQQPLNGSQPGFNMSGGYNPMMGRGGYPPQNPYRGGYQ